jgi:hypothetical protein
MDLAVKALTAGLKESAMNFASSTVRGFYSAVALPPPSASIGREKTLEKNGAARQD